jgi:hypothetical protein
MRDLSVREASRSMNLDYANHSAHLFLANSYDALRDPRQIDLRYETPWLSELLVANLLAQVNGAALSQTVSQQEYSRLFAGDDLGFLSNTEYQSRGDWLQSGSLYGTVGRSGFALDALYRDLSGDAPNTDVEQFDLSLKFKQQLTARDSVMIQAVYSNYESGDPRQYYHPTNASPTLRVRGARGTGAQLVCRLSPRMVARQSYPFPRRLVERRVRAGRFGGHRSHHHPGFKQQHCPRGPAPGADRL